MAIPFSLSAVLPHRSWKSKSPSSQSLLQARVPMGLISGQRDIGKISGKGSFLMKRQNLARSFLVPLPLDWKATVRLEAEQPF